MPPGPLFPQLPGQTAAGKVSLVMRAQKLALPFLVFAAPMMVVVSAHLILNRIIEVGAIDVALLPEAYRGDPAMMYIPAKVIAALYNLGFALSAIIVLSLALILLGSATVWRALRDATGASWIKVGLVAALVMVFIVLAFDFSWSKLGTPRAKIGNLPTGIAQELIGNTIENLPRCDEKVAKEVPRCTGKPGSVSIGNTGSSVEDVVVPSVALVAVAGLAYLLAVAAIVAEQGIVGSPTLDEAEKWIGRLNGLSFLAAITFVATVIAVDLLFQPGAEMIKHAYAAAKPKTADMPGLLAYQDLALALRTYWATIFSLALAFAHFGAMICLNGIGAKGIDLGGFWKAVKAVLTVLSPTVMDWALKFGDSYMIAAK